MRVQIPRRARLYPEEVVEVVVAVGMGRAHCRPMLALEVSECGSGGGDGDLRPPTSAQLTWEPAYHCTH